jgi:hypothetical protein
VRTGMTKGLNFSHRDKELTTEDTEDSEINQRGIPSSGTSNGMPLLSG